MSLLHFIALILASAVASQNCQDRSTQSSKPKAIKLFDGQTLEGWAISQFGGQDQVVVQDGAIVLPMGYPLTGITYHKAFPKTDYEISIEAKRVDGNDFFCCVTFPVQDQYCSFVVGGWAGSVTGISCIDSKDASENETTSLRRYEKNRWYKVQISVTDRNIVCKIDQTQVVNLEYKGKKLSLRPEVLASKPMGICCFETTAALRNITLRSLATAPDKKD